MITFLPYSIDLKRQWDDFIDNSKNGTFLLKRDYLEYHEDRYIDLSLMAFEKNSLVAVIPMSLHGNQARSHGGLTYGGVICNKKMTTLKMLSLFDALLSYLSSHNVDSLLYKRVPSIYHVYPSDEDLYALFKNNAELISRGISSTIYLPDRLKFSKGKKWGINQAKKKGIIVKKFYDYDLFIDCENAVLKDKHNTTAVHTSSELSLLSKRFPNNISLYGAFLNNEFLAGSVIYETNTVAHTQYIATTEKGRDLFAFDILGCELINSIYKEKIYFDFGISTEDSGKKFNEGLCQQKESFGGRGIVYDTYLVRI